MKKATILISILLIMLKPLFLGAQLEMMNNSNYWYSIIYYENLERENNKKHGVKKREIISTSNIINGRKYQYDTAGRLINHTYGRKKEIRTDYINNEQKKYISFHKKGKLIELDSFIWNGKTLSACYILDKNKKVFKRQRYKYDSTFVTEYVYEKVKKEQYKELEKYTYEYYPDYTYKKITRYRKGKPRKYTMFDCNPQGENHKTAKDSANVCVKYDVDSLGNKIKITISNHKGSSWKKVEYFNNKDERIADKTYNLKKKGELMWAYFYETGNRAYFTRFISYKKGKEFYKAEYTIDQNGKCTESRSWTKGKLKKIHKNTFNEKGLLSKAEMYNRKNKKKRETEYLYEYY
jgi:hypothetical protein